MTAKEKIIELIDEKIYHLENSGMIIKEQVSELKKLKSIIENPTKITFQVSNTEMYVTLLNQQL